VWKPQWGYFQTIDQINNTDGKLEGLNMRRTYPQMWPDLRCMQLLFGDENVVAVAEQQGALENNPANGEAGASGDQLVEAQHEAGPMSPIVEGSHEDSTPSMDSLDTFLANLDDDLQEILRATRDDLESVLEQVETEAEPERSDELDNRVPLNYLLQ